jgi:hypothetical protein
VLLNQHSRQFNARASIAVTFVAKPRRLASQGFRQNGSDLWLCLAVWDRAAAFQLNCVQPGRAGRAAENLEQSFSQQARVLAG